MMFDTTVLLSPWDTCFFRDGRPFNQRDEGLAEAKSLGIPTPRTFSMALRAAVARGAGWRDCDGPWAKGTGGMPGHGVDQGGLRYSGPIVSLNAEDANVMDHLVFPVPAMVGEVPGAAFQAPTFTLAAPLSDGRIRRSSDLESGSLIGFENPAAKRTTRWIRHDAFTRVLRGEVPVMDDFIDHPPMVAEHRVGITRSKSSHVATKGMLYAATRQRPWESGSARTAFVGQISYPSEMALQLPAVAPLGGDGRFATTTTHPTDTYEQALAALCSGALNNSDGRYLIVLITPMFIKRADLTVLDVLPGRVTGIATVKNGLQGGRVTATDSSTKMTRPIQSSSALGAGTVIFMDASTSGQPIHAVVESLDSLRRRRLGHADDTDLGYGEFVYGQWF